MRSLAKVSLVVALLFSAAACASSEGGGATAQAAGKTAAPSAAITAAVADAGRPQADKDLDADRKPADMLAFADVKPGMKIGELIPGGGYMTRSFSKAIGPQGKLYLFNSAPAAGRPAGFQPILDDKTNYANVSFIETDFVTIKTPEPLDLVWTSQNYHDMHNPGRNLDIVGANKAVLAALKPGGTYIVLDHQSAKGVEFNAQLHRIDKEKVKSEVLAAGFQFVGESTVLANTTDDGAKVVFDPSVRHKTNQFILKFRRPK